MEKKSKSYRGSWIITVPLAGLAVAYVFIFFLPTQREIGELRDDLSIKREFITQAGSLAAALETTKKQLNKTLKYNAAWEENAPAQNEFNTLFSRIHTLAKEAGATTTRFDPEPDVEYNTFRKAPLAVGCTGSFPQLFTFLRSLESLPQEIWIEEVRLEELDPTGKTVECNLVLGIFADNPENSDQGKHSG